jgi:hypothetical protein
MIIKHLGKDVYVNTYTVSLAIEYLLLNDFDYFNEMPTKEDILDIILLNFNFKDLELIIKENKRKVLGINSQNGFGDILDVMNDVFGL